MATNMVSRQIEQSNGFLDAFRPPVFVPPETVAADLPTVRLTRVDSACVGSFESGVDRLTGFPSTDTMATRRPGEMAERLKATVC